MAQGKDLDDRLNDGTVDLDAIEPMMTPPGKEPPAPAFKRFGDVAEGALARFERRARGEEKPIPLPFERLARVYGGGLWPGLHVFVGGTGKGKTQFALQLALHAADSGTPALYIGLELGELDWVARLLGARAKRPWSKIFLGDFDPAEMSNLRLYADGLERLPLYLIEGPPQGWPYVHIRTAAEELRVLHPKSEGPALLVLDFLQIIGTSEDREELRERIGRAAYLCRAIARDLDFAVLVLSSTARDNYAALSGGGDKGKAVAIRATGTGSDRRGVVSNPDALIGLGKESGEIEYAADSVLVPVFMPSVGDDAAESKVALVVPKVRAGRPGWVNFSFNGYRFAEHDWPSVEELRALNEEKANDKQKKKPAPRPKSAKPKPAANGKAGDATPPAPWGV